MIWKTDTHMFSATVCQRTGTTCPALARLARTIAQAMATAGPVTTADFEVQGCSDLTHCKHGCTARFDATPDLIRVYCGTAPETSSEHLGAYADMMFGDQVDSMPGQILDITPCAMLQAAAFRPKTLASNEVRTAIRV